MYLNRLELKHDALKGADPRCRLSAGLILIIGAVQILHVFLLFCLTAAVLVLLFRDIKTVFLRLIPVNLFCGILCVTVPLGGGSINAVIVYILRINAAAVLYMIFIIPLGIGGLAAVLAKLKVSAKLVSLLTLTYRYLFVMYERVFSAILSIRLRRPRQSTAMSWRSYTGVFASALASAFFRSQKIHLAMRSRGFDGVFPLTRVFAWKMRDTVTLFAVCIITAMLLIIDRG
ncbi:MAG: energy-coupling factor transporter transmembrane protein EcfT [Spirochaetaceae bacterium]|jgi:cobalt/nickel transport system permease protein|nr:energy-coupling factor transporter transmembrane protein EcfT [Spirochaetaceae bacterium]